MNTFGERIRQLRKAAGITQGELAQKLNVHLQTVSKWERGISEPDIAWLGELSAALGVSLERLAGVPEGDETFTGAFDAAAFGKNLSALRKERGELQEELAALLCTTSDIVSKWERGVICPDAQQLAALAQHFGVPLSKLYFAIGENVRTHTVAQVRRRAKLSYAWLGGAAVLAVAAVACAVILPQALEDNIVYTVTAGDAQYQVSEHDWFTPAAMTREGYDFVGYADEGGELVSFPTKIEGDTRYTAVFSPHAYAVDYWLNGGYFTGTPCSTFTVESGTLQLPRPVKAGASFEGWYLQADYSGNAVRSVMCEGADIALYARWSDEIFTVRYELGGGVLYGENPAEVSRETEYVLEEPVRAGYNFLGWYDTPSGGVRYERVGGEGAKNLTLYALWQESGAVYTVLYDLGGGEMTGENPAGVGAGEVHTLAAARRTGYDFLGWNDKADGSGTWYDVLYGIRGDLTLCAVWSPKEYTVRYELDGGTFYEGANPNVIEYGTRVRLLPVAKYGHTFLGWYDALAGGNAVTQIGPENILRISTLYARFEANEYSVRLLGAGGTFPAGGARQSEYTLTLRFGDEVLLPDCTRAGYDFLGWYDEEGKLYEKIDIANLGDLTLTARYRVSGQTYSVEYVLGGGVLSAENPSTVGYGQAIELNAPEREGYLFLGWNDASDGSGEYYAFTPAERESAFTLYAIWQEILVSGSADNFTYRMGQTSVTVTGYTGPFGENVDLVIPSYIGGKPVVAVEGRFDRYTDSHPQTVCLNSLTIPETVVRLGDNTFNYMSVTEPVVIPASVEEIGFECFKGTQFKLEFAEGSSLTQIGDYAFSGCRILNIVRLPEGVHTLWTGAFHNSILTGMILPDTLKNIYAWALAVSLEDWWASELYLPKSVEFVEDSAFTSGSLSGFQIYPAPEKEISGITLDFGDRTQYLAGAVFDLPEPEKEGYRFVGWYDAEKDVFAGQPYIPRYEGVVLEAVFSAKSAYDGSSVLAPAQIAVGAAAQFVLRPRTNFYFVPQVESGTRVRLSVQADEHLFDGTHRSELFPPMEVITISETDIVYAEEVFENISLPWRKGTVFKVIMEDSAYYSRLTIRFEKTG